MATAAADTDQSHLKRWHGRQSHWHGGVFAHFLLLGFLVTLPPHSAVAQTSDDAKVASPKPKQKASSGADDKPQSESKSKPKPQDTKPKKGGENVPPPPPSPPAKSADNDNPNANASNANNNAANLAQATPPNFGRLDAGQGQLLARSSVPGFFGDLLAPGGNVVNVPGTPLHFSPQTPNLTPLALGFAAVSAPGVLDPQQLYFRSVTTTGVAGAPFYYAPNTQNDVYKTNVPGINLATPPKDSTYQLNPIPPQSNLPVGYFVPFTATQVTPATNNGKSFLTNLQNAPPTNAAHPLNDVIAVGTPITNLGPNNQGTINAVYGLIQDTHPPGFIAQPLVFQGGAAVNQQIPILFVLTSNTSTSVYSPSAAAGGTQKLVDNASPLPRDRVFFNYSYFDNSAIVVDGHEININRITPGFEKTFLNQQMSVEVRVPFATTIDNVDLTGTTNTSNIMLGNQTTYLKSLLYSDPNISFSSGLGIQLPTAASTQYTVNGYSIKVDGTYTQQGPLDVLKIRNEAVHLLPYLGAVYTPNDRFYAQSVAQLDFATNGNTVYNAAVFPMLNSTSANTANWTVTSATTGLTKAGSLNDTNFMYLSANAGYWLYKVKNPNEKGLTGFAPTAEVHYNQSLTRGDTVSGYYGNPGSSTGNISQVNGVIGANTVFGQDKYLSVAYVLPMATGVNRAFDGELRVMFNYYFGAPRVNPRFSNVPGQ